MRTRRHLGTSALLTIILLAATGCGGAPVTDAATVDAVLDEWHVTLSVATAPAGAVVFRVANHGRKVHELALFKTDYPDDQLPVDIDGMVDERGPGVQLVEEVEDLAPGMVRTFHANVTPGRYVLACNLASHYLNRMHAPFTVG